MSDFQISVSTAKARDEVNSLENSLKELLQKIQEIKEQDKDITVNVKLIEDIEKQLQAELDKIEKLSVQAGIKLAPEVIRDIERQLEEFQEKDRKIKINTELIGDNAKDFTQSFKESKERINNITSSVQSTLNSKNIDESISKIHDQLESIENSLERVVEGISELKEAMIDIKVNVDTFDIDKAEEKIEKMKDKVESTRRLSAEERIKRQEQKVLKMFDRFEKEKAILNSFRDEQIVLDIIFQEDRLQAQVDKIKSDIANEDMIIDAEFNVVETKTITDEFKRSPIPIGVKPEMSDEDKQASFKEVTNWIGKTQALLNHTIKIDADRSPLQATMNQGLLEAKQHVFNMNQLFKYLDLGQDNRIIQKSIADNSKKTRQSTSRDTATPIKAGFLSDQANSIIPYLRDINQNLLPAVTTPQQATISSSSIKNIVSQLPKEKVIHLLPEESSYQKDIQRMSFDGFRKDLKTLTSTIESQIGRKPVVIYTASKKDEGLKEDALKHNLDIHDVSSEGTGVFS